MTELLLFEKTGRLFDLLKKSFRHKALEIRTLNR